LSFLPAAVMADVGIAWFMKPTNII